jgi:hypothetical protein
MSKIEQTGQTESISLVAERSTPEAERDFSHATSLLRPLRWCSERSLRPFIRHPQELRLGDGDERDAHAAALAPPYDRRSMAILSMHFKAENTVA